MVGRFRHVAAICAAYRMASEHLHRSRLLIMEDVVDATCSRHCPHRVLLARDYVPTGLKRLYRLGCRNRIHISQIEHRLITTGISGLRPSIHSLYLDLDIVL